MPNHPPRIPVAIVEDEPVLREELAFQLEHLGFSVQTFENAHQLYRYLATTPLTLVVLDIGLEGEDGLSICQYLRSHDSRVGIVMTTARSLRDQRIEGLQAGADAYLVKPIDVHELALILRRLAERNVLSKTDQTHTMAGTGWHLDPQHSQLRTPGGVVAVLTLTESRLMRLLMEASPQTCTYAQLGLVLGVSPDELDKHRLEVIISRLRSKVLRGTGENLPLLTDRNQGYRWVPVTEARGPNSGSVKVRKA